MTTKIDGTKYPFENEATDEAGVLPTHDEMMRLVFNNKSVGRVIIYSTTNSDKDGFVNAFNNNLKS
jgi:hypothetical protein